MSGPTASDPVPLRRPRSWLREWPIGVVLIGVALAMLLIALDSFRAGAVLLSASVLLAAFLRLFLPEADAGMLVVRSRRIDVTLLAFMGIGLSILSFWVPPPS
jgi:hypothetical protein